MENQNNQSLPKTINNHQMDILKTFKKRLTKDRFIHNQASVYYSKQNQKFVIPGILITGISSVASFMATSDILGDDSKKGFSVGVGILTAGATILQSVSSSFGFQSRAEAFQKAADSYDTLLTRIEFEICNPNEDFDEFSNELENEILKIKNDCKYLPPLFIQKLWEQQKNLQSSDSISNISNKNINNIQPTSSFIQQPIIKNSSTSGDSVISINTDMINDINTKNIKNETSALFEDAIEKQNINYRSIDFIEGKTTPSNNLGTKDDPEHIV